MNPINATLAAAAALAAAFAASPAAAQFAEGVAAIVNDEVISTFDVRQRANLLLVSAGVQPTQELQERARAQALRELIDEHLKLQETREYEINISDDDVDRQIGEIARSNQVTPDVLAEQLAGSGVAISTLRSQIKADMAWSRLVSGRYGTRIRISEREIRETQERIAANATRPQYLIAEIFLPADNEQEFAAMMSGAQRLLEQMQRGASFPAVARQFSASPSAAQGGDIGWISANELAVELQPVAERLQPGQVSVPIRARSGVYIIAMRDRREGEAPGAHSMVTLRQATAPAAQQNALQRALQRAQGCAALERDVSAIPGAAVTDLGETSEADLSAAIRARISGVAQGGASSVVVEGEQANAFMVCAREAGGANIPNRREVESRLREQELEMLSQRYLRNLRTEATIITR